MKAFLILLALAAAACGRPEPAAVAPADKNVAEKYVGGLQTDVTRAQEAKDKADAANKKAQEAEKLPE